MKYILKILLICGQRLNLILDLNLGQRFDGKDLNKVKVCPQIFKSMQINSDGRVIPCCIDFKTANLIGDLNKESVKNIWNGQELIH